MKKICNEIDKIDIFSTGLFKVPYSNMYKFCLLNEIDTVGKLFNFIENFEFEHTKLVNNELIGIIDLLKYKYLFFKMDVDLILNSKFIKQDYLVFSGKIDWYRSKQIRLFRRLGFTKEEGRLFILYADKIENNLNVGECLILFFENFDKNVPYQPKGYYDVFKNKIILLIDYFKRYSKLYNNKETLKKLYLELENLITKKNSLEYDINNKKLEIENMLKFMSLKENNEEVMKLMKHIENNNE